MERVVPGVVPHGLGVFALAFLQWSGPGPGVQGLASPYLGQVSK